MRGTELSVLRQMLKAEIGDHLTVGAANDAVYNALLSNKQKFFESTFDWPFLKLRADVEIPTGQRYFALPRLNLERPIKAEVSYNNYWFPVCYDIDSREFNLLDSDRGDTSSPVMRWRLHDEIEINEAITSPAVMGTPGANTYNYKVSFVVPEGETLPGGQVAAENVNAPEVNQIDITTIPISVSPYVTGRRIYRTKAGGSVYYLLATIDNNFGTTFTDTTPDSNLTQLAPTRGTANVTVFEIWPLLTQPMTLRFNGIRVLRDLVNDTDNADLDDTLLVLSVAADRLALLRQPAAQSVAVRAQQRLQAIRAAYPVRDEWTIVGGGEAYLEKRKVYAMAAGGDRQVKSYSVDPNIENVVPGNINQPALCYQKDGTGPIFTWNTVTHIWQ